MAEVTFEGQAVVVTGAGGGLGRAYAREIARRGGRVVVNDLGGAVIGGGGSPSLADGVVAEIKQAGGQAVANYDDVSTEAGARRIMESALDSFGRLDAVIANAGNMRFGNFEDLTLADLNALLAVHVGGSWNVAQAAWPHMKAQSYGRLVFVSSSTGLFGAQKLTAYGAAKGGITGLMHCLSHEGAGHGILCNAIMPNAGTRMTADISEGDLGENPWAPKVYSTFDPDFTAGLGTFLASRACTTTHGLYSSLGGRVARTFVGVTKGHQGAIDAPMSADEVAANWDAIRDDGRGYAIIENVSEEFRYVVEGAGR